jgi:putative membrane protein
MPSGMTEFPVVNALIFAGLGLLLFLVAFSVAVRVLPFDLKKEIVQERNTAAAILAAAVVLGMAWIVAATMH